MVSLRGESLTTHRNPMKLFNAITAAAVISAASVSAIPAFGQTAPNGWRQGGCFSSKSGCLYVKVVSTDYPFVTAEIKDTSPLSANDREYNKYWRDKINQRQIDCRGWKSRDRDYTMMRPDLNSPWGPYKWTNWSSWDDLLPGTVGAATLQAACS